MTIRGCGVVGFGDFSVSGCRVWGLRVLGLGFRVFGW